MPGTVIELEKTELYTFTWDSASESLRFTWTDKTSGMSDQDFRDALNRYAKLANERHAKCLLVDVRQFRHRMTDELAAWRDKVIAPRYNQTGVQKFAYVVPEAAGVPEGEQRTDFEDFPTQYFKTESAAFNWLTK